MPPEPRPVMERVWPKVEKQPKGCWIWKGAVGHGGYGRVWVDKKQRAGLVHRVVYEHERGPIPAGLTIDHLCRNRVCVNPDHLAPCTIKENLHRSSEIEWARRAKWTHCPKGHPFDERNTGTHHGRRTCRKCSAERMRKRRKGLTWT